MLKHQEEAIVVSQERVAFQTYRLRLAMPGIARLARPGQFFMLQVGSGQDPLLKRPFSFHRIHVEEAEVEVLYRVVGKGTWRLSTQPEGARLHAIGPLGNGFELPRTPGLSIALVAGGIGVAPLFELMAALRALPAERAPDRMQLFYGARTGPELMAMEAFEPFNVTVHLSTDDGTLGFPGYVPDLLRMRTRRDEFWPDLLYSCGPLAMQYYVARWTLSQGVPSQLSLESVMACGIGACLGCALPARLPPGPNGEVASEAAPDHYVHVCKDGPIFPAGSIQWHKIQTHQAAPQIFLYN